MNNEMKRNYKISDDCGGDPIYFEATSVRAAMDEYSRDIRNLYYEGNYRVTVVPPLGSGELSLTETVTVGEDESKWW